MLDKWLEPVYNLYGGYGYYYLQPGVPRGVLLSILIAGLSTFVIWFSLDRKQFIRKAIILLFINYIVFLVCSTIIFRSNSVMTGWNYIPFWSYQEIAKGRDILLMGNILNILVFVPIGFLAGFLFLEQRLVKTIVFGIAFSSIIELGQFFFSKGFAETDDIIHNTFGCMIGFCFSVLLLRFVGYLNK